MPRIGKFIQLALNATYTKLYFLYDFEKDIFLAVHSQTPLKIINIERRVIVNC